MFNFKQMQAFTYADYLLQIFDVSLTVNLKNLKFCMQLWIQTFVFYAIVGIVGKLIVGMLAPNRICLI